MAYRKDVVQHDQAFVGPCGGAFRERTFWRGPRLLRGRGTIADVDLQHDGESDPPTKPRLRRDALGMGAVIERFRRTWRSEIRSSLGFSVRIIGKTGLLYTQGSKSWRFNSEAMAGPGTTVVLYADSIPDDPQLDRLAVVNNVERAFLYAGWHLMVHE